MGILQTIVAILIPPLGVFWKKGFGFQFFLSLILTLAFYVPGMIYSLYVVVLSGD